MATLRWSKIAEDIHIAWAGKLAADLSVAQMYSYLNDIKNVESNLQAFPSIGKACPTTLRPNLRHTVSKLGHSVYYELDDPSNPQHVEIIATGKGIPIP